MSLILSNKNKPKFSDQGCLMWYDGDSSDGSKKFWRCDKRKYGCKARIHTEGVTNRVVKRLNRHNHDESAAEVAAATIKNAAKRRAEDTQEQPSQIVNTTIRDAPPAVMGVLSKSALKQQIRRTRNRASVAPPNPHRLQDLDIPQPYRVYKPTPDTGCVLVSKTGN